MQLLLASKSPRRRELLSSLDLPLSFVDIEVEEQLPHPVSAAHTAEALARLKASGYDVSLLPHDGVLITADTVVVLNDRVMGKPHDEKEAFEMLQSLSGVQHQVYTGVCLSSRTHQQSFTECTHVWFKHLSPHEIQYYIDHYRPFDKAGAYGIQEWIGRIGIQRIDGCFYNVVGLPVARLNQELQTFFSNPLS